MKQPFYSLLIIFLTACQQHAADLKEEPFVTRTISLPCDTTIHSLAVFNNYLLCAQANGKLIILDTNYARQPLLEDRLNKEKIDELVTFNDSVFLVTGKKILCLTDSFNTQPYTWYKHLSFSVLFEDFHYRVRECCIGEFGGTVFFHNKQTGKTYFYPATCAAQVLSIKQKYFVCTNLAHLAYNTSYFSIDDPEKLYEVPDSMKNHCNWWVSVDSISDYWQRDRSGNIRYYNDLPFTMTLLNFCSNDSVYAVVSGDSATYLTVLRDSAFVIKDTLLKKRLNFHKTQVVSMQSRQIGLLKLTGGSPFEAYWVRGNSSALIVVNGHKIDLLLDDQKRH